MKACFCVEVITVNTCSLLSLIGLQLVLIACEGGLASRPRRSSLSVVTVGKSALGSAAHTMHSQVLLCPVWLVAS